MVRQQPALTFRPSTPPSALAPGEFTIARGEASGNVRRWECALAMRDGLLGYHHWMTNAPPDRQAKEVEDAARDWCAARYRRDEVNT